MNDDLEIVNQNEVNELLDQLSEKLKEAKELAQECSSVEITIRDKTRKEISYYIEKLNEDFIELHGFPPESIVIRAEGRRQFLQISLP